VKRGESRRLKGAHCRTTTSAPSLMSVLFLNWLRWRLWRRQQSSISTVHLHVEREFMRIGIS
jgi:hypothetical protein